jgi:hypothetical protein
MFLQTRYAADLHMQDAHVTSHGTFFTPDRTGGLAHSGTTQAKELGFDAYGVALFTLVFDSSFWVGEP